MSGLHVYMVDCDAEGCDARLGRELGWSHHVVPRVDGGSPSPVIDLCPDHQHEPHDRVVAALQERRERSRR